MVFPDDLLRLTRRLRLESHERIKGPWQPAADVYRTRHGWVLKFELPGVRPEDVEVHVHGRYLTITGFRTDVEVTEAVEFHSLEIAYTRFQRAVELPREMDNARIETQYRAGMLLVYLVTEDLEP